MNPHPDFRKACYRCGKMTDVTVEEMRNGQKHTCCTPCRDILGVEADAVKHFPKDEASQPQAPASPANPT